MSARLAVVVVNYGSSALLEENLTATAEEIPEAMIVVIDNHSSDAEAERVRALGAARGWIVILHPRNDGFGAGVNLGAERAFEEGADEVLVINPDARIDGASVARLTAATREDPLTLAAPVIRTSSGAVWFDGADLYLDEGETRGSAKRNAFPDAAREPWISGACVLMPRQAYERTGGFDPDYFLYWEDVDLSWRAVRSGVRLVVVEGASAVHDAGGTQQQTGGRGKSRTYYFYNARNRLLFAAKHLDPPLIRRWLRATPRVSWAILMRGGRRQLLTDPGLLTATFRGARAGRRLAREALSDRGESSAPA